MIVNNIQNVFFISIFFSLFLIISLKNIELTNLNDETYKESEEIIYNNINSSNILEIIENSPYRNELVGENGNNIDLILYDSFPYQNSQNLKFKGLEFRITILSGEMKIYKYLCKTYPDCTTITKKNSIELIPLNGFISEIFEAYEIANLEENEENYIVVICEEKKSNFCKYEIAYHRIEGYHYLGNHQGFLKYIGYGEEENDVYQDDKYIINLKQNTITIIDLIVYSGDAFIIMSDGTFNDYDCKHNLENIGLNQRWILTCKDIFQFKNKFHVRANGNGAVYYIYFQQIVSINEEQFPLELTIMHSLNTSKNMKITLENDFRNYYTIFNPINCDLKIKKGNKNIVIKNQDVILDYGEMRGSIDYNIENKNSDTICFFYVSSFYYMREDSFIILTESKPYSAILNSEIRTIRMAFPFATSNKNPKLLIRITLYEINPLELIIKVGSNPEKKMNILQSTDIIISNETINNLFNLTYKRICPIKIIAKYLGNENTDIIIDVNIKTMNTIPYLIKTEKFLHDINYINNQQYYLAVLNKNSKGFISINTKRGAAYIYGKIFTTLIRRNDGKIELPFRKSEKSLNYSFIQQKLFYEKKDTKDCYNICYLIFGIEPIKIYGNGNINNIFDLSEYSLLIKNINSNENNIKYINIPNDEFIMGNTGLNEFDYYQFNFPSKNNILRIDFESENCQMTLSFINDFNIEKKIKYEGNGDNQIFEIPKKNFISYFNENINIKIKIELKFQNIDYFNTKYKFKLSSPIDLLRDINIIDTSLPVYCDKSLNPINEYNYCDYLMNINAINNFNLLELYAFSQEKERKIEIYANIVDSNYFMNFLYKENLVIDWPNKDNYNYSSINKTNDINFNILQFNLDRNHSYKILIRVYINGNYPIALISNLVNQQNCFLPIPLYKQIIHISQNISTGLFFNLTNSYNLHFQSIEKNAPFNFQVNKYKCNLQSYNDRIIVNSVNERGDAIVISRKDIKNKTNICYVRYYEINLHLHLEKINIGKRNDFIYDFLRNEFLYYSKIEDIEGNLFFNIIFNEFGYLRNIDENIHANYSENFDIKGYLFTQTQMNNFSINSNYLSKLNTTLRIYNGYYNLPHKQGNFIIPKEDLLDFKNQTNEDIYILINISKSTENTALYNFFHSTITLLQDNEKDESIPPNTYLSNYFRKKSTNIQHYYKIEKTTEDQEIILEFSCTDKKIFIEILNPNEEKIINFEILKNQEEIGKKLIKIKNEFDYVILLVSSKNSPDYNIFYTFKYYFIRNFTFLYKYNPNASYVNINDDLLSITIDKIKYNYSSIIAKCNYYFRLYKLYNKNMNDYTILTALNDENPYYTYKIHFSDSSLNDKKDIYEMKIPIPFKKNRKFFIDIIAETMANSNGNEYLAYNRLFPIQNDDSDNKKIFIIIFSIIGIILICAGVLLIFIFIYRKDNKNMKENIQKISFFAGEQKPCGNSTTLEDDDIEDDGNIF